MERNLSTLAMTTFLAVGLLGFHSEATGQPVLPGPYPALGGYANIVKEICGKQGLKWQPKELPWIGCFGLPSESRASGTIAGRQLEVTVDSKGEEVCKVDGTTVARTVGRRTNVPNVTGALRRPCILCR
jgi:hypothetical protein